jgi:hypothetical protein
MDPALEKIRSAADGLLFMSESDSPLEPLVLKSSAEGLQNELKTLCATDTVEPIEVQDVEYFFRNQVKTYPGYNKEQTDRAARFVQLIKTLHDNLSDIKVYRVGTVQVNAFIIGKLKDGQYAGLRTKLVET